MADGADLLRAFIADEAKALISGKQGLIWPRNHHRIEPLIPKAPSLLSPDERTALYRAYMRINFGPPKIDAADYDLLRLAYKAERPAAAPLHFTYMFGSYGGKTLPSGEVMDHGEYEARQKAMRQCMAYTALPHQRTKIDRFMPYVAEHAEIMLETLRFHGYIHDRRYLDFYSPVDLLLWAMVLIILLDETLAVMVVDDILSLTDLPQHETYREILAATVHDVLAHSPNPMLKEIAAPLFEDRAQARAALDSLALIQSLGLPQAEEDDWAISITLPHADTPMYGQHKISLLLRPHPDYAWQISVYAPAGKFSQWSKSGVTQNDLGLPELSAVAAFPAWAKAAAHQLGMELSADTASISVGRKRSAIKLLKAWLFD